MTCRFARLLSCLALLCATGWRTPPRPRLAVNGGSQSEAAEKVLLSSCPAVRVTTARGAADYIFSLDHQAWSLNHWKHDRWDLARANGDVIASGSASSVARAAKAACAAVAADLAPGRAPATPPASAQ